MSSQMKQALLQLATPPFDSGGVRDGLVHKSVSRAHSGAESELSTASTALTNRLAKQKSPGSRPHQGNNVSKPSQAVRFCIDREFVQMEIRAAQEANKNIITVFESDSRKQAFFDYGEATEKYRGTEWEYLLHIDATTYRRDTFEARAMIQKVSVVTPAPRSTLNKLCRSFLPRPPVRPLFHPSTSPLSPILSPVLFSVAQPPSVCFAGYRKIFSDTKQVAEHGGDGCR